MAKCAECGAIRELYTIAQKDRTRLAQALAETALELQVEREDNAAANRKLRAALELLVADIREYEAWQRPCFALDKAITALAQADEPKVDLLGAHMCVQCDLAMMPASSTPKCWICPRCGAATSEERKP